MDTYIQLREMYIFTNYKTKFKRESEFELEAYKALIPTKISRFSVPLKQIKSLLYCTMLNSYFTSSKTLLLVCNL